MSAKKKTARQKMAEADHDGADRPWLDDIKILLNDLKNDILEKLRTEIKSSTSRVSKEMQETTKSVESAHYEIDDLKKELNALRNEVSDLKNQVDELKKNETILRTQVGNLTERQIKNETYNRRENLIIYGMDQENNENCFEKIRSFMTSNLKIPEEKVRNMIIQRCHRLKVNIKPQPMICRFQLFSDRMTVWNARLNLKNTRLSLNEDFPPEILARRKVLYPVLKAAQKDKKPCKLLADKLIIEEKTYTTKDLHMLPPEYDPAKLATIEKNGVTAFFSKASPLSNFYQCELHLDDYTYFCVEQYYQEQKATFGNKVEIAENIRKSTDPAECKRLGSQVLVEDDKWLPIASAALRKACWEKFSKNRALKDFILKTGNSEIAEASNDKVWGVGFNLQNPKVHQKDKWLGDNRLGQILMNIRKDLQK